MPNIKILTRKINWIDKIKLMLYYPYLIYFYNILCRIFLRISPIHFPVLDRNTAPNIQILYYLLFFTPSTENKTVKYITDYL